MNLSSHPEGLVFNPDQQRQFSSEKETFSFLEKQLFAYRNTVIDIEKDRSLNRVTRGQKLCKSWVHTVENIPNQGELRRLAIEQLNRLFSKIHPKKEDVPSFIAGFFGELASGTILHRAGLETHYPDESWDLRGNTDFIATYKDGVKIFVQTKVLSLPEYLDREGRDALPVFSSIKTPDELKSFTNRLMNLPITDTNLSNRITEIISYSKNMHVAANELKVNPVICLLGSPESMGSDINAKTADPRRETLQQGIEELSLIHERLVNEA